MERAIVPHKSGPVIMMVSQPCAKSPHPRVMARTGRRSGNSGGFRVACLQWRDRQERMSGLSSPSYSSRVQDVRGPSKWAPSHTDNNGKDVRRANFWRIGASSSVLNDVVDQSGSQMGSAGPATAPSSDVLKDQLQSLQNEALQVCQRCKSFPPYQAISC
jgi:hypothetical protein